MAPKTTSKTQVVHFSVEGGFLTNFVRSKFVEDTPKKAVHTLMESLPGMPEDLAIEIITGKKKLVGINDLYLEDDNETQLYSIPLNFDSAWSRLAKKYLEEVSMLQMIKRRIVILGTSDTVKGAQYRNDGFEDETMYDISLLEDRENFKKRKERIDKIAKELAYAGEQVGKSITDIPLENLEILPDFIKLPIDEPSIDVPFEVLLNSDIETVGKYFSDDERKLRYAEATGKSYVPMVDSYLAAQRKIDENLKEKIKPNPITDMNDAGWLAPSGEFYGLNGEISNLLHNQLADALAEAGIVTPGEDDGVNVDGYMMKTGWTKIHHNNVLFEGYSQRKYGVGTNVKMTDEQIRAITLYGKHLSLKSQVLRLGLAGMAGKPDHMVSGARFEFLSHEDLEEMFDF